MTDRALIFDLDGVLIDGMKFHLEAWQAALAEHGVALPSRYVYLLEGIPTEEVLSRVQADFGLSLTPAQRTATIERKEAHYRQTFEVVPLTGVDEVVASAIDLGYTLCLVTGTTRLAARSSLAHIGVLEHFACVVSSEDLARGKPAPDPYLRALDALHVQADRCLVVENAPAGLEAAKAAGIERVAVASYLQPSDLHDATRVFANLSELRAWLLDEASASGGRGPWQLQPRSQSSGQ